VTSCSREKPSRREDMGSSSSVSDSGSDSSEGERRVWGGMTAAAAAAAAPLVEGMGGDGLSSVMGK
jgi:hypothetical protein